MIFQRGWFRAWTVLVAVCSPARPGFAQSNTGDLTASPLRSLVPDESDLPSHLFDALDHFTLETGLALRESDTRVVWLLDSSPSLQGRRETIAAVIPSVIRAATRIGTNQLETFVVGYGAQSAEFLHLEESGSDAALERLASAFRRIPADSSGQENVFGALIDAAKRYAGEQGNAREKQVLFFVLADEPGDDSERLEEAMAQLNDGGVRCSIAGHVTSFLSARHFMNWTYEDGFSEEVSIDAGIETAVPQRLFDLPLSPVDPREISSGFGPWPLARLCAETDGRYLLDWSEYDDRFDEADLDKYAPKTSGSMAEIQASIEANAACRALTEAVHDANSLGAWPGIPNTFSPDGERDLAELLTRGQKSAAVAEFHLTQIHRILQPFASKREVFTEPRWRADYDLSIARVRAARVRLLTYNLALSRMKSAGLVLDEENDAWQLERAPAGTVGAALRNAIRLAESDLNRVIGDHPGTPWAAVAERELSVPWGWEWEQVTRE